MTKCHVCRTFLDRCKITCSICVNNGSFRSFKEIEITESPDFFLDYVYERRIMVVDQNSETYADRLNALKKIKEEKRVAELAFEERSREIFEIQRMIEDVKQRKFRLQIIKRKINECEAILTEKKCANQIRRELLQKRRIENEKCQMETSSISTLLPERQGIVQNTFDLYKDYIQKLTTIRQEWIDELSRNIFPIERISTIESELSIRIEELADAQQSSEDSDHDHQLSNSEYVQYRIVSSSLPANGKYRIYRFAALVNFHLKENDQIDSFQLEMLNDFDHFLAALGYACQLSNVLADLFCIDLPHNLSHAEFNTEEFDGDILQTNIDKLNANIISLCRSQNVYIDNEESTHTLENLSKLLSLRYKHPRAKLLECTNYFPEKYGEAINCTPTSTVSSSPSPSLSDDISDSFCSIDENMIRSMNTSDLRTISSGNPSSGDNSFDSNSRTSIVPNDDQSNSWIRSSSSLFNAAMRLFRN